MPSSKLIEAKNFSPALVPVAKAINTPATAPPATSPVENKEPLLRSYSSALTAGLFAFLSFASTIPLMAPPIKIGSVVASGK